MKLVIDLGMFGVGEVKNFRELPGIQANAQQWKLGNHVIVDVTDIESSRIEIGLSHPDTRGGTEVYDIRIVYQRPFGIRLYRSQSHEISPILLDESLESSCWPTGSFSLFMILRALGEFLEKKCHFDEAFQKALMKTFGISLEVIHA